MTAAYRYEIATRDAQGRWRVVTTRRETFEREPRSVAHALMVRWVLDQWAPALTGRVHVFGPRSAMDEPRGLVANVRIRVYLDDSRPEDAPLAAAYLGEYVRGESFGRRVYGWLSRARHRDVSVSDHSGGDGEAA